LKIVAKGTVLNEEEKKECIDVFSSFSHMNRTNIKCKRKKKK
jgi:hypothetical protein